MQAKLNKLKARLKTIHDLHAISSLLFWDQATYMPPGGAQARGRQRALIEQMAHEHLTDKWIGQCLDSLLSYEQDLPYDSDDAALIRVTRRQYQKAIMVPAEFMARLSEHGATCYAAWIEARREKNFDLVRDHLEKNLDLSRELAGYYPGYEHIADPLIDIHDEGMTVARIRPLFADLRQRLVPLVEAICDNEPLENDFLHDHYPSRLQQEFCTRLARKLGYDTNRGRVDLTHHPFMIKFAQGDVRITTRIRENDLSEALFSSIHETGHALYEQNIDKQLEASPLDRGASGGVHESQSRLWENLIGRSREFWINHLPLLRELFPDQLSGVDLDRFCRGINHVERSLIRTDADEVTYNLHVMIRFELELELLEGALAIRDLPDAWNERYQSYLGVCPPDDSLGVLQDMHWYEGVIGGAFQSYTLGNLMAAQIYQTARQANPDLPTQIAQGHFEPLLHWLTQNIYRHGRKFLPEELIQRVTGRPLSIEPFMAYLQDKYGQWYRLP